MSIQIVLFDRASWRDNLLPLVATRPVGNLRIGILTLDQKWQLIFQQSITFCSTPYLQKAFVAPDNTCQEFLVLRADLLPNESLILALQQLKPGERLMHKGDWIAFRTDKIEVLEHIDQLQAMDPISFEGEIQQLLYPEHIFVYNARQIQFDFDLLTRGRTSANISTTNVVLGDQLFVEEGALVENCSLNTLEGPIYVGKNAKLEEGSILKGPIAICEGSRVKMGAKIYPNVTVGDRSVVGGEVNNTVIWGDSAKGHDGYMGCAVIGQFCNFGAGSSNSNLRNDWKTVTLYNYSTESFRDTNLLKCGLVMGDHSHCAIHSTFSTGTVLGVAVQVAISRFVPRYVDHFTWLTDDKNECYDWDKFINMLQRRANATGNFLTKEKTLILAAVYQHAIYKKNKSTLKI